MKMSLKKPIVNLFFFLIASLTHSQNDPANNTIVEKNNLSSLVNVEQENLETTDNGLASIVVLKGSATKSSAIKEAQNSSPTVTITSPHENDYFSIFRIPLTITADAADADGTVVSVEFFADGRSVGIDSVAPYAVTFLTSGTFLLVAKATDNEGLQTTSSPVHIFFEGQPPITRIETPYRGDLFYTGDTVTIVANANYYDEITLIRFTIDGVDAGIDTTAPYTYNYPITLGNHYVQAVAVFFDGSTAYPDYVNITGINPSGTPYTAGAVTGGCFVDSFCLPIIASDTVKNVIGYDIVMQYDKTKVTPTGRMYINNLLIDPAYATYAIHDDANGSINISIFLNATAPANTSFHGKGELCCVDFIKKAAMLARDTINFNIPFLQESYVTEVKTKLVDDGIYINTKSNSYNGVLQFWSDNSPIKYDEANPNTYLITNIYGTDANCANKEITPIQPNYGGYHFYTITNRTALQIERDIPSITNVQPIINGMDAALGRKVLLNDISFIPSIYQMIALDVNTDGVVSAGDISQINQRSIKTILEFKQKWNYNNSGGSNGQLSKDWLFLDSTLLVDAAYKKSLTYPANDGIGYSKAKVPVVPFCLQIPDVNTNICKLYKRGVYIGVVLGDVDGNYASISPDGALKRVDAFKGTINFNLDQAVVGKGFIDVPVSFTADVKVYALDFALNYNEQTLNFQSVVNPLPYLTDAMANYATDDHTLRFTSNSRGPYEADKNIVFIRFATTANKISCVDLTNMIGYLNGRPVKLEVKGNLIPKTIYPHLSTAFFNLLPSCSSL